jgi:hypothetical protein
MTFAVDVTCRLQVSMLRLPDTCKMQVTFSGDYLWQPQSFSGSPGLGPAG